MTSRILELTEPPPPAAASEVPWHLLPPRALPLPGNGVTITDSAARVFAALAKADPLTTFFRGGAVVELDSTGAIKPVFDAELCSRLERHGATVALRRAKGGELFWAARECSKNDASLLLATLDAEEQLPPLALVSSGPLAIDGGNGSLRVLGAGYHRELGGVLVRSGRISAADLPDPIEAAQMISEILGDYDFLTGGDRSRAIAAFLAPALQFGGHFSQPVPFDVSEADVSQAGKGFRAKLLAALYGEKLHTVGKAVGGVGSIDEQFQSALIEGRPFILLDNIRGSFDSQVIEAFATADYFSARGPYRRPMTVEPKRFIVMATSNGLDATRDFANRSSIVRNRKRPTSYSYRQWPEGDILAHVEANRMRYLAAVFSIIRAWLAAGKPRSTPQPDHDRREWAASLDWIVQNLFCSAPLMDGHRTAQERVSNPALNWLRDVALAAERAGKLGGDGLSASNIAELCEDEGITIPGLRAGGEKQAPIAIGRIMGRLFRETEGVSVDGFQCTRGERWEERLTDTGAHDGMREIKAYKFSREGR